MENIELIRSRITQEKAEQLIAVDYGFCVIKDLEGRYIDLTTKAIGLITNAEFRSRKQAMGRFEHELVADEDIVRLYQAHDKLAILNDVWLGLEPSCIEGEPCYVSISTKYAIEDEQAKIVGCLVHAIVLENEMLYHHLQELKEEQSILSSDPLPYFQFEFQQHFANYGLTPREAECLFYTIHGKTAKAIGTLLGISSKTVEYYLANLKAIFKCYSKSELISKAIEQGFLKKMPASILKLSAINMEKD